MSTTAFAQSNPGANYESRNFQYLSGVLSSAATTSQVASAWNAAYPPKYFSFGVTTTATGWEVDMEGSLDNSNWTTLGITTSALGVASAYVPRPMLYVRLHAVTIGANTVTATAIAVP